MTDCSLLALSEQTVYAVPSRSIWQLKTWN